MLTGLEILIARMKDHPDEFILQRRWDRLVEDFRDHFTQEELNAYKKALAEIMRDRFNESVLKKLAGEEEVSQAVGADIPVRKVLLNQTAHTGGYSSTGLFQRI